MPCNDCDEKKEEKPWPPYPVGKFRFLGGSHEKSVRKRGPYLSYETGKTYVLPMRYANSEAYPYWELVEGDLDASALEEEAEQEEKMPVGEELGLKPFKPLDEKDRFYSMSEEALKIYIRANGGQVDGRWGKQRLVEEALKLQ